MKRVIKAAVVGVACLLNSVASVSAAIILENNEAGGGLTNNQAVGQSLTTPAGGPWDNLSFGWFNTSGSLVAGGSIFLLSQEYLGSPGDLSNLTTGFIAGSQSTTGGQFFFEPSVVMQPNTKYFLYTDVVQPNLSSRPDVPFVGGDGYTGISGTYSLFSPELDNKFRLSGEVVPEPTTLTLTAFVMASMGWYRRRRT